MELRDQLQAALGSAFTLERELGRGGMSRVYLAQENALGRQVVVKALAPELTGGVNIERFRREIQLAAQLQHPHIVSVLAAGEMDGVPYFTMPYVRGESLRARLNREGPLPIPTVIRILRDVAKALAFAHRSGVVHRDIKPENIMLQDDSALVLDFGVAKALSESAQGARGEGLTTMGVSLGTPGYMAPEQAAADPNVDARADIYAFGLVGYEMLVGKRPFAGRTPQETLAATLTETPPPVSELRPDVPPPLADLITRCLAKNPQDRPQSASELLTQLDALDSSGGVTTRTIVRPPESATGALAQYIAASGLLVLAVWGVTESIGLPHWVVPSALIAAVLGLPFVARAGPRFTTRRLAMATAGAIGAFALVVGGFLALRALGVGPAGNLVAAGLLKEKPTVLVTDFGSPSGDSTLGSVVSDALRTDLEQSRAVTVVQQNVVQGALRRMQRPPGTRVDLQLAREIAAREGIGALVDGDVSRVGTTYIITARIYSAASGDVLAAIRQSAADSTRIVAAIDKLSRGLRARVGESLKSVRDEAPLADVTTPSIEALRRYTQGVRAAEVDGDQQRAADLLEQAIALDSNFAMAYRKLGVVLSNMGAQTARGQASLQKAYDLRDHLPEREKYLTIGTYFMTGPTPDPKRALAAFDEALAIDPRDPTALVNSTNILIQEKDFVRAESYVDRVAALDSIPLYLFNQSFVKFQVGKTAEASADARRLLRLYPLSPDGYGGLYYLQSAQFEYDSANATLDQANKKLPSSFTFLIPVLRAQLLLADGKVRDAVGQIHEAQAKGGAIAGPQFLMKTRLGESAVVAWFLGERAVALRTADSVVGSRAFDSLPALERPYPEAALSYILGGRLDRARTMVDSWDKARTPSARDADPARRALLGQLAIAERRYDDAIASFRAENQLGCPVCGLALLSRAYDLAGNADSAIAIAERAEATRDFKRIDEDGIYRAAYLKRLGELYDAKGDRERALTYYGKFVALWSGADPELQVQVQAVRKRMAALLSQQG
ncbi:MAG TPA: protein kinase [Gemmatimonadaceae bacterium]|nr:protein kinase [Gemmatimonadaceae bacterium]